MAGEVDGLAVWTCGAPNLPVRRLPEEGGFLIGDSFDMSGANVGPPLILAALRVREPLVTARQLSRQVWGSYVAVLRAPSGDDVAIYRDPSGMLEAFTWALAEGVQVVASRPDAVPAGLGPRWPSLNWDRITRFVAAPTAMTTEALFDGLQAVGPGELVEIRDRTMAASVVWSPSAFAQPSRASVPELRDEMVRRVDSSVQALLQVHPTVLMELSGGLDSSILSGAIGATGSGGRVAQWLNYRDVRREADETRFARAVTDRLGVELTTHCKARAAIDHESLTELARSFWPAIGGIDADRDRDEVRRLHATGATAIVSGQGGDGLFYQFPSALIAADEFHRKGLSALASPVLADVARRTRQSVWAVLAQVRAARRGRERRPTVASTLLSAEARAFAGDTEHAWTREARLRKLPPGKVLHIQGIALNHFYRGPSRRLAEAEILLPFLAQPILELGLSIPVPDLAGGNYDRPFARQAFAHRLPDAVRDRRAKGAQSVYFAKLVAGSLDWLRPYLLDGRLCAAGILDRALLEQTLDPQALIWGAGGAPMDVLNAAAAEAWVQYWQTRRPDSASRPCAA